MEDEVMAAKDVQAALSERSIEASLSTVRSWMRLGYLGETYKKGRTRLVSRANFEEAVEGFQTPMTGRPRIVPEETVRKIRRMLALVKLGVLDVQQYEIARRFGVSEGFVSYIKSGKRRKEGTNV